MWKPESNKNDMGKDDIRENIILPHGAYYFLKYNLNKNARR